MTSENEDDHDSGRAYRREKLYDATFIFARHFCWCDTLWAGWNSQLQREQKIENTTAATRVVGAFAVVIRIEYAHFTSSRSLYNEHTSP